MKTTKRIAIVAITFLALTGAGCASAQQTVAPAAVPSSQTPTAAPSAQPTSNGATTSVQKSDIDSLRSDLQKMDSVDLKGLTQ